MTAPAVELDPKLFLLEERLLHRYFAPKPRLGTAAWATERRVLSTEASSAAGKFRPYPYQLEPMHALDDPEVRVVTCVWPSQIGGKTEIGLNWFGRTVDLDPCPMLVMEPTLGMAKSLSEERFDPMFRDSPALSGMLAESGSKGRGNRMRYKRGHGWVITMIGARSAADLSMRPIKKLWCDEPDRYPTNVGGEGAPMELADARTRSFWDRQRLNTGTPVWEDMANSIWVLHQQASGGEWVVPCPHCNFEQPLVFGGVDEPYGLKWEPEDPEGSVQYLCAACASLIPERYKGAMNLAGRYQHAHPERRTHRSFHFEGVASELMTWADGVRLFLETQRLPEKLQTWQNTYRALPYRMPGEEFEQSSLQKRRLGPLDGCPEWCVVLLMSVDVQDNRLEVSYVGFGAGERCWMKIVRLEGDTSTIHNPVWKDLDRLIGEPYPRSGGGQLRARIICIDIGHRAEAVSEYVRRRRHLNVRAVRGVDGETMTEPATRARKANKYGIEYWRVSNTITKRTLFRRLARIHSPGPGHLAFDCTMDDEMIDQFLAEKLDPKTKRYEKIAGRRNEAIDLWSYAYAGLWMAGAAVRTKLQKLADAPPQPPEEDGMAPASPQASPPPPSPRRRRPRRSGWVKG